MRGDAGMDPAYLAGLKTDPDPLATVEREAAAETS
jgi:hypothetical protein